MMVDLGSCLPMISAHSSYVLHQRKQSGEMKSFTRSTEDDDQSSYERRWMSSWSWIINKALTTEKGKEKSSLRKLLREVVLLGQLSGNCLIVVCLFP